MVCIGLCAFTVCFWPDTRAASQTAVMMARLSLSKAISADVLVALRFTAIAAKSCVWSLPLSAATTRPWGHCDNSGHQWAEGAGLDAGTHGEAVWSPEGPSPRWINFRTTTLATRPRRRPPYTGAMLDANDHPSLTVFRSTTSTNQRSIRPRIRKYKTVAFHGYPPRRTLAVRY